VESEERRRGWRLKYEREAGEGKSWRDDKNLTPKKERDRSMAVPFFF
jgi:hypothetical protein